LKQGQSVKKVLLLRLGAMGDVCLTVPLVRALQEHVEVHWLVWRHYAAIPQSFPGLRCRLIPVTQLPCVPALVGQLRAERYDAVLDLSHWPQLGQLVEQLGSVPQRAATFDPDQDRLLGLPVLGSGATPFNSLVPVPGHLHQLGKWRQLVRAALQIDLDVRWPLPQRRPRLGGPCRVFLHPHAGKPSKLWPLACFVETVRRLSGGRRVLCDVNSGGRPEAWRGVRLTLELLRHGLPARIVPLERQLKRLRAAFRLADFALGCDSGPMHFAGLLGVPTVVVYGPYTAREFAPVGPSWAVEPAGVGLSADAVPVAPVLAAARACLASENAGRTSLGRTA